MWPGRVSLKGRDQPATPVKTLDLPENSREVRTQEPSNVAENQRRSKELAALGEEKSTERTTRFEQERKGYNSEHWRGGQVWEEMAENMRTEGGIPEPLCMQMRDIPQVYTKTKFGSTACLQKQDCHSGQGPSWTCLGDLDSHGGRAPP